MAVTQTPATARRRRDPESTRAAILEAAKLVLARDGAEGLSVSTVAKMAGVNRGTAYQHFKEKDALVRATLDLVSLQLLESVFTDGNPKSDVVDDIFQPDLVHAEKVLIRMTEFNMKLAEFAIDNPEIGRIWLFDVLSRDDPKDDPFYKRFELALEAFADSSISADGIDVEVQAVQTLTGYFIWPVWVRAHAKSKKARKQMAIRYVAEVLRSSALGLVRHGNQDALKLALERIKQK